MRKRGLWIALAILGAALVLKVVTVDRRDRKHVMMAIENQVPRKDDPSPNLPPSPTPVDTNPFDLKRDSPPVDPSAPNVPPPIANPETIDPVRNGQALDDPMRAVDSFLARNRKEADDSIQALTREAETLRARLQKVEAALARWQEVSGALNAGRTPGELEPIPTASGPHAGWRQPGSPPESNNPDPARLTQPAAGPTPPPGPSLPPGVDPGPDPSPPPAAPQPASTPASSPPNPLPEPAPVPPPGENPPLLPLPR